MSDSRTPYNYSYFPKWFRGVYFSLLSTSCFAYTSNDALSLCARFPEQPAVDLLSAFQFDCWMVYALRIWRLVFQLNCWLIATLSTYIPCSSSFHSALLSHLCCVVALFVPNLTTWRWRSAIRGALLLHRSPPHCASWLNFILQMSKTNDIINASPARKPAGGSKVSYSGPSFYRFRCSQTFYYIHRALLLLWRLHCSIRQWCVRWAAFISIVPGHFRDIVPGHFRNYSCPL